MGRSEDKAERAERAREALGSNGSTTCENCGTPAAGHSFKEYGDTKDDPLFRDIYLSKSGTKFRRDPSVGNQALCPSCWTDAYWKGKE